MIFNPDLSKQAQEVIISRKIKKLLHPTSLFNNIPLANSLFKKHVGLALDIELNFSEHIKSIIKKITKTMGLLHKFQQILPSSSLLTTNKNFTKLRLGYADMHNILRLFDVLTNFPFITSETMSNFYI